MARSREVHGFVIACMAIGLLVGGCPGTGGNNDGTDGLDGTGGDTTGGDTTGCNNRTITTLPPAGYVEVVMTTTIAATPADSALAKVIYQAALCPEKHGTSEIPLLYEIDAQGNILAMISLYETGGQKLFYRVALSGEKLTVENGCVRSTREATDTTGLTGGGTGGGGVTVGPCGVGQVPITREGLDYTPDGDYICVEVHSVSACEDCRVEDDVWRYELVATAYLVAQGTLSGVSIEGWATVCDPAQKNATVTINSGDRVDIVQTTTFEYRVSQSPEALGYTQISYAP